MLWYAVIYVMVYDCVWQGLAREGLLLICVSVSMACVPSASAIARADNDGQSTRRVTREMMEINTVQRTKAGHTLRRALSFQ